MARENMAWVAARNLAGRGLWRRVEQALHPGMPDGVVTVDGMTTWFECKELVRGADFLYRIKKIQPSQPPEWVSMIDNGAWVYFLLRLFSGAQTMALVVNVCRWRELLDGVSAEWLAAHSFPLHMVLNHNERVRPCQLTR